MLQARHIAGVYQAILSIMKGLKMDIKSKVKAIQEQLKKDVEELEAFAKAKNLPLIYERREVQLQKRLNDEFITYPRINVNGFGDKHELVQSAIDNTKGRLYKDIRYTFKFKPNTDKLFQVKVTSFHYISDIIHYLNRATSVKFPNISVYAKEDGKFIIKKYQNDNAIIQLTEEQFNTLNDI